MNCKLNFILLLAIVVLTSCGRKEEKETPKRQQLEEFVQMYKEACNERNFDQARTYAQQAADLDYDWRAADHFKYVNEKEIYLLLANNSRDNAGRILYLFNSEDADRLPDMADVMEVAVTQGNEYLAQKLLAGGVKPTEATYTAAMAEKMDDLLLQLLETDDTVLGTNAKLMSYVKTNPAFAEVLTAYQTKEREEFLKEITELSSDILPAKPATGMVKNYTRDNDGLAPLKSYNEAIIAYNARCKALLMTAIERKDWTAANRIISCMKPTLEWTNLGDWAHVVEHDYDSSSAYEAYKVSESTADIDQARQLLAESKN